LTLRKNTKMSVKDACYRKVKASYKVFPSARASQAIAKCRKESGSIRKGEGGSSLRRWEAASELGKKKLQAKKREKARVGMGKRVKPA
jgi:hypothetical protein